MTNRRVVSGSTSDSEAPPPTRNEIAVRAYELFLERGEAEGRDVEDWLEAERELVERPRGDEPRR